MAREKMVVNERAPNADLAKVIREGAVATGTPVCVDINEARDKLLRVREQMLELGVAGGFKIAGAGTHPFSRWEGREEMLAQYRQMAEDAQVSPVASWPLGCASTSASRIATWRST
jgi:gamma-glutamyl:cysteine ligase YbdK (ATP-grasp superfamily)